MRIELNYQVETLEEAICQAIVQDLGYGMPPREILDQLISRGFIRDPGNNALEDAVQALAEVAEQMRCRRATLIGWAPMPPRRFALLHRPRPQWTGLISRSPKWRSKTPGSPASYFGTSLFQKALGVSGAEQRQVR